MLQVPSLALPGPCVQSPRAVPLCCCPRKGAFGICEQPPRNAQQRAPGRGGEESFGGAGGGAVWMQQENMKSGNPQGNEGSQKWTPHFHLPIHPRASQHSVPPGHSQIPDHTLHTSGVHREEGGREGGRSCSFTCKPANTYE